MKALEIATDIELPDEQVVVVGDIHGNFRWLDIIARATRTLAPDVTTMLQLGDWAMDPGTTDELLDGTGIERIYVTLGNHDRWDQITPLLAAHPGAVVRVSDITWILPRPARMSIGGRSVLSVGGAVSVDKAWRQEGVSWWKDEEITRESVTAAIAGGPADLMLTHESPAGTPVRAVREILRTNPMGFPDDARADSSNSRARVTQVWDAVRPELLIHGHMHTPGGRSHGGRAEGGQPRSGRPTRQPGVPRRADDAHRDAIAATDSGGCRAMTDKNPWAEIVGPCYRRASLARALVWTEDEVTAAAASLQVLERLTDDDVLLYPRSKSETDAWWKDLLKCFMSCRRRAQGCASRSSPRCLGVEQLAAGQRRAEIR